MTLARLTKLSALCALIAVSATPALAQGLTGALKGPDGKAMGTVTVTPAPKGVRLRFEATGLTPGWHGAHFHAKGDCGDEKFLNSGGHVHGGGTLVHGLLNPQANDNGDLPNIFAGADGKATAEAFSSLVTLETLKDADGTAIVIHASADDHSTQPIGGAGARIACAVLK